jgi:naringenin degradation protein FdeD
VSLPKPVLPNGATLCRIDELADPGCREFRIETLRGARYMFVVRKGANVYGYMNWCPHYGATLDWKQDQFLNYEKTQILCSLHGAEFAIEDGACVLGPCEGDALRRVSLRVADGTILLDLRPEENPPDPYARGA